MIKWLIRIYKKILGICELEGCYCKTDIMLHSIVKNKEKRIFICQEHALEVVNLLEYMEERENE